MGRGKVRGRKLTRTSGDHGSSDDEKLLARKRRGRPQKLKEEIEEDDMRELLEDENGKISMDQDRDAKYKTRTDENAKNEEKAEQGNANNENCKLSTVEDSNKGTGFRQNRGRRKSKPRRAAEAVVECN